MIEKVFKLIDFKLGKIAEQNKRASIILINEELFKRLQQGIIEQGVTQKQGMVKSPHDTLSVYKNCKILTSQVVETVEVF